MRATHDNRDADGWFTLGTGSGVGTELWTSSEGGGILYDGPEVVIQNADVSVLSGAAGASSWRYTRSPARTTDTNGQQVVGRIAIVVHDSNLDGGELESVFARIAQDADRRPVFGAWQRLSGVNLDARLQSSHGLRCGSFTGSEVGSDDPFRQECPNPVKRGGAAPPSTLYDLFLLPNKTRQARVQTNIGEIVDSGSVSLGEQQAVLDEQTGIVTYDRTSRVQIDVNRFLGALTQVEPGTIDQFYIGAETIDRLESVLAAGERERATTNDLRDFWDSVVDLFTNDPRGYDVRVYVYEFYPAYYRLSRQDATNQGAGGGGSLSVGANLDVDGFARFHGRAVNIDGRLNVQNSIGGAGSEIRGVLTTDRVTMTDFLKAPEVRLSGITTGDNRSRGLRIETSGGGFLQGYTITGMYRVGTGT
ncbi:MAG: hypothetical protein O3A46_11130, partial [Candidatus Poribacteria bacterium]|nr:hypothetical protein [Candidatus Poribacteria bacterium]